MKDKNYRFAFDVGTNSLGWAVYELDNKNNPIDLTDTGVRIFSDGRDPKSGESLAVERRGPRAMRRRRDRYLQRRTYLMDLLIKAGLMPQDEAARKALEKLDPYVLRARGLDEALSPHEFGRVLFHLNQRRGFQSNRIADAGKDEDSGKIKTAEKRLIAALEAQGCRTYGEFLAKRQAAPKVREREAVRIRIRGQGAKALYEFYPTREILKHEFEQLWSAQAEYHPALLTSELKTRLYDAMFFQRPLKQPPIGKCTFFPEETRIAKSHPLSQARRIYQDLNHLKLKRGLDAPRSLTLDERDKLATVLLLGQDITLKAGLRQELKLSADTTTTLEEGGKADRLVGDQVVARLSGKKGPLKQIWGNLTAEQRADIALRLNTEQNEAALIAYLMTTYNLPEETARLTANTRLPDGHDMLGPKATAGILEKLKAKVITYNEAVFEAFGKSHSDERDGVIHDSLPFYGEILERHTLGGSGDPKDTAEKRYGRIANPTVHVGLNQLRRVTNALIRLYGNPEEIVVELARDLKMSKDQKDEKAKEQKGFEDANKKRKALLEESGYEYNPGNIRLLRLWEELGPMPRRCIYSGEIINLTDLMSGEVEIEHILPYSRTLDDSMANKTLSIRMHNRLKRNKAPAEAFSGDEYESMRQRAQILPPNKRWRFEPDAMEKFDARTDNGEKAFLARQLNETKHLAVMARKYLVSVCNREHGVRVVTGQMTSLLRQRFGLNNILSTDNHKNRDDHRHHAIDACVIGIIDTWILQEIANQAENYENKNELSEITKRFPEPFRGMPRGDFRDRVKAKVAGIIVSHKPEHGAGGALHNESNYGINQSNDAVDGELITRKAIDALTWNEIDKVRDLHLREKLQALKAEHGKDVKALAKGLADFGADNNIRRVRILKKQADFITIKDRKTGAPYRAVIPGENHHMDIIEGADGVWRGFAASIFDVNQKDYVPAWKAQYPGAKLIMRVHKGDLVSVMDDDGETRIKRIVRLSPSNNILYLVGHNEGGEFAKRHADNDDPFRWDFANISKLKDKACRLFVTNELGKKR